MLKSCCPLISKSCEVCLFVLAPVVVISWQEKYVVRMYPCIGVWIPYIMHIRTQKPNYVTNKHMFGDCYIHVYVPTYIHSCTIENLKLFTHNLRMYNWYIWSNQNATQWVCTMGIHLSTIYIYTWHCTIFYL